jgi:hypothetical protein
MSYFKAVLTLLISFHTSSSLMGMDVYSNSYFEQKLQKTLSLLMAKNNDPQSIDLNKDTLLVIAKHNYDLYCDELLTSKIETLSFKEFWEIRLDKINDKKRINTYYGQEIKVNDFDFITINDQGRKTFLTALSVCERDHKWGNSSQNTCTFNLETIDNHSYRVEKSYLSNHNEYKKILQLPLRLRSKLGNLSHMIIIGEEQFSYENAFIDSGLFEGCMSTWLTTLPGLCIPTANLNQYLAILTCAGICGIGSYHIQKKDETFPVPTMLIQFFLKTTPSNRQMRERVLQRNYSLIKKPLVPEKYTETLALKKQTEQELQRSRDYMIKHHRNTTHTLLTQE